MEPQETDAQRQARLRREKRAAKIQAGGTSRLDKITSLQGAPRSHAAGSETTPASAPQAAQSTQMAPRPTVHDDPAEVDISQHHFTPQTTNRPPQPNPFTFNGTSAPPFAGQGPPGDPNQDPMMAMMQQMLGAGGPGGPGMGQGPGDIPGLPPGFANILKGMQGGEQQPPPTQSSAYIWRIIHALFSLALAVYIVLQTPFNGSKLSRTTSSVPASADDWAYESPQEMVKHFFYAFATFEVILQSSRYFVERGQLPPSGFLGGVAQIIPEPYAGYVRVIGRYSVIWRTVVSDAMVVVFILGAAAWWRGGLLT